MSFMDSGKEIRETFRKKRRANGPGILHVHRFKVYHDQAFWHVG